MASHSAPVVRVRNVTHRYGSVVALEDVTLDFPSGRMLGLIGPDGVGKSTLLGLLAGARKMQVGEITVLGGSMAKARHRAEVFSRAAYMPQGLGKNLYMELSVAENLDFFARLYGHDAAERRRRMDRLLRATGLDPFPDRPAGKLSGGMKQKLGLCCALIHDPDFLILDEPTTGVDPLARRQFWNLIDEIRADRPQMSVLVSTAYMEEAERFEWLVAMDAGHILASGAPGELRAQTGTEDLESAYVSLLPPEKRGSETGLHILPRPSLGGSPAIVARGLTRRFGDFTAVRDVSFEIERGEIFGFLGSNGCGKTTTMKMLTGLLPASEGEAWLFGEPVDATNIETRKRVGFMSQNFSLWGELTVRQNLMLHARLFHLPTEEIGPRIAALLAQFGLEAHADAISASLPLGLRQRLSLACAIIHGPDMLILDEPTSGVDPVARDEFWALLVDLSRRDEVTIFLSTHFMNEAMRCDRISLMHAGEVLVYDTPQNLAREEGSSSLEETFIRYIEGAIGQAEGETAPAPALAKEPATTSISLGPRLGRLFAVSRRELLEVMRDPVRLAFAFLGSMILMLMFAYGISSDIEDLTFAAFDQDHTPESRAYIANFQGSPTFVEQAPVTSIDQLEERMAAGAISLALEIPRGFGRAVTTGAPSRVAAWIDGANTMRAATIEGYVQGAHATFLTQRAVAAGVGDLARPIVEMEPRYRYNPGFESLYSMAPSIPAILLMLFPAILMAVSIAREREIGTITNFHVTPTGRLEYLLGKQLPYVGIGFVNWLILTLMTILLFGVPLTGSALALALGAVVYVYAATGFGMLVAVFTRSQVAAVFATMILAMLPTVQFSGLLQPVSTLEGAARVMGQLWPTNYFMQMSVGAFNKGLGFGELAINILLIAAFAPASVGIATFFLRKQER
ncbi:ribosome-associated ATPase/putative transporter RbbA [Chelativorans sp. Marseille-P2723]|uniref:ribosome-associated ATPase/putative transporter RbbA n=1 Tax=Chelativorans sp. Marseille-P2723 TaxID=2709133 RepID=UPI00156F523E|nr:ribosome-associated ATPase/putative transporter RbbA [Chelativorans sp. Marseille-P2723]